MKLRDLAAALGCELQGDGGIEITGVAGMEQAAADQLTFLANPKYAHKVKQTRAGAILVPRPMDGIAPAQLISANPYFDFARALELFYQPPRPPAGIHPTASIAASARIGENASIGPYAVVGENATIGRNAVLRPHVVIYDGATIGDDFYAHSHAVVREFCRIGDRVTLQNGVIVGGDGFGFAKRADGTHLQDRAKRHHGDRGRRGDSNAHFGGPRHGGRNPCQARREDRQPGAGRARLRGRRGQHHLRTDGPRGQLDP